MKIYKAIVVLLLFILPSCNVGKKRGIVIDKYHKEEYVSFLPAGVRPIILVPIHHSEQWYVKLNNNGYLYSVSVRKEIYDSLCIGDSIYEE